MDQKCREEPFLQRRARCLTNSKVFYQKSPPSAYLPSVEMFNTSISRGRVAAHRLPAPSQRDSLSHLPN